MRRRANADQITHDEHRARNGETWRRVREAGVEVEEEVLRLLRERG